MTDKSTQTHTQFTKETLVFAQCRDAWKTITANQLYAISASFHDGNVDVLSQDEKKIFQSIMTVCTDAAKNGKYEVEWNYSNKPSKRIEALLKKRNVIFEYTINHKDHCQCYGTHHDRNTCKHCLRIKWDLK